MKYKSTLKVKKYKVISRTHYRIVISDFFLSLTPKAGNTIVHEEGSKSFSMQINIIFCFLGGIFSNESMVHTDSKSLNHSKIYHKS